MFVNISCVMVAVIVIEGGGYSEDYTVQCSVDYMKIKIIIIVIIEMNRKKGLTFVGSFFFLPRLIFISFNLNIFFFSSQQT